MKCGFLLLLMAIAACVSTAALAHGTVGLYVGAPGRVYAAPPPIFYRNFWAPAYQAYPPPVVYQSPPVVYGPPPGAYGPPPGAYGWGGYGGGWDHRERHDNGWQRGGENRRQGDDN
jgi:hypothetical protein